MSGRFLAPEGRGANEKFSKFLRSLELPGLKRAEDLFGFCRPILPGEDPSQPELDPSRVRN